MIRLLLSLVVILAATPIVASDGPAEGIPELKALSNYVGTWNAEVTSPNSPLTKATHTAEWILGGRFLEQKVSLTSADGRTTAQSRNLMTFDPALGRYRIWSFVSDGNVRVSTGSWDDATRTMTTISRDSGLVSTTTARFAEDGHEQWEWQIRTEAGATVFQISGDSRRQ
jgi:hypothetical protein